MADNEYKPMSEEEILSSWDKPVLKAPKPAAPETPPSAWRRVPDIGVAALKSAVAVPEAAVGLLDIPTGGAVGRGLEKAGVRFKETQKALSEAYSPQQKAAYAEVSGAFEEGFVPGVTAALRRPSVIGTTIAESALPMLSGGAAARGIKTVAGVPTWLAGAAGEGLVGAGSAAEQIRQAGESGYLSPKQALAATASGVGTAALGALGAKAAGKLGVGDIETMLAGKAAGVSDKGFLKRAAASGFSEGVLEELPQSIQEQMWQNYALDRPLTEGLSEAAGMGLLAGAGIGAGVGALSRRRDLTQKTTPTEVVAQPTIDTTGTIPDMFTGIVRQPGWTDEHQAALDAAIQSTTPTDDQGELFAPMGMGVGGAPLQFGVRTGEAGPRGVRGNVSDGKATKRTREVVADVAKITKRADLISTLDKHLDEGRITPEQHDLLRSDATDSKVKLAKIRKNLESAILENAPPEAQSVELPKLNGKTVQPVATGPAPIMPTDSTLLPEYEAEVVQYMASGIPAVELAAVMRARGAGAEEGTTSARTAAKRTGVSHETERNRVNKGLAKLQANAVAAGVDWDAAQEMMGIALPKVEEAQPGFGAYEGGARTAAVEGEEFEPTYGMERTEDLGEEGAAVEGEDLGLEPEVSTEEVLDVGFELAEAERLMNKFAPETVELATAAWGAGFTEQHPLVQMRFISDVADLIPRKLSVDSFMAEVAALKGARYVTEKGGEPATGAKVPGRAEGVRQEPGAMEPGERGGEGVSVGRRTSAEGVTVTTRKRRVVARSERTGAGSSLLDTQALTRWHNRMGDVVTSDMSPDEAFNAVMEVSSQQEKSVLRALRRDDMLGFDYPHQAVRAIIDDAAAGYELSPALKSALTKHWGKKPTIAAPKETTGNTADRVSREIRKAFFSGKKMSSAVEVVEDEDQLPEDMRQDVQSARGRVQGLYDPETNKVWLIARNIPVGNELSVLLHEVGVHMGMRKLIGAEKVSSLTTQVQTWALEGSGIEGELANKALARVRRADKTAVDTALAEAEAEFGGRLPEDSRARIAAAARMDQELRDEELIAYFVEEAVVAGIDPTLIRTQPESLKAWLASLMESIKRVMRKLGVNPESLTAQDVVDLAYGAAGIELQEEGKSPPADGAGRRYSVAAVEGMTIPQASKFNENTIATAIKDQAKHALDVGLDKVMFTEDLVQRAVTRGLTTAKEFGRLMAEKMATRDLLEQDIANVMSRASDLSVEDKTAASNFIRASTVSQKWGYVPAWDSTVVVDEAMKRKFGELSPVAREVVKDVFSFGNTTHTRLQKAINQDINDEFDALLVDASEAEKVDIEERRAAKLRQVGEVMPKLDGPYAPLKRFGNHVMVAMSKEFAEAKKNQDTATMEKLQSDERHLLVEHFDTRAEALNRTRELRGEVATKDGRKANYYPQGSVETWVKQESYKHVNELPWAGVAKVKSVVEGLPEDSKLKRQMQHMLTDLYLTMMAESSARKSELKRKNVAGANTDMFRSFASQGASTAHFITSLENSGDISRAMVQMQLDARGGAEGTRHDRTAVLNELTARYAQSLEYNQTPLVNRVLKMTSFWMLLTSPAFYVQNALQPFMITAPFMAGRFGAKRTWGALTDAYRDVGKYALTAGAHQLDIDSLNITSREKAMLKEMQKYGRLDLTLTQDIGRYTEGESMLDKGLVGKVMRKVWTLPQHVELLNRVASALAAYRLATGSESDKTAYAGEVVSVTHGNYSSFNAPRFFTSSGAMRLVTQFRKFQLIQLTLLAKLAHSSFNGASPEEKVVARRSLAWILGQQFVVTGALGMPIPAVAWAIAAALGADDDEPVDPEQWMRNTIGDADMADLLTRGVPAYFGMSMSQKIGMGNAFSPLPFADIPKDRAGYEKFVTAVLGAPVSVGAQWADGLGKMRQGEYYKGVEAALPSGLKNAMRGYRFATDGVTSGAGDTLLAPEDVSLVDSMAQAMGLPTMKVSERQRRQGVVIEANKFYSERTTDVKRSYIRAHKEKDTAAMAEAREEWRQLQAARVANGFKRQPMSDLLRAPIMQRRREQMAAGGVEFDKSNRKFVERLI